VYVISGFWLIFYFAFYIKLNNNNNNNNNTWTLIYLSSFQRCGTQEQKDEIKK